MQTLTNERVKVIFDDLLDVLRQFIIKHRVTEPEYRAAMEFVGELGRTGEVPLWFDVFLGVTVDDVTYEHYAQKGGTSSNILGPYYVDGAPVRSPPAWLGRDNEPGDVLFVSGRVLDAKRGAPIPGALLDVWQAAAHGRYDIEEPDQQPPFNMRGKLFTDGEGRFEFRTVVPGNYEVPKAGPTGRLLAMTGRHAWRPRHIHFKVSHDSYSPLTTQVYFEGDQWLHDDCVGAVKPDLVTRLEKHDSRDQLKSKGLDRPFYTARFDFSLVPAGS